MRLTIESKRYEMDSEEYINETMRAFEQIQSFLNELSDKKELLELTVETEFGDMHNGADESEPKRTIVSNVNIIELFEDFFSIGHYDYEITVKPENTGFVIESISTYHLSSAWFSRKVEVTVSPVRV